MLLDLRPALESDDPGLTPILGTATRIPLPHLAVAALVGLAIAFGGPFLSGPDAASPWLPSTWTPEVAWHRVLGPIIGVWIAWFAYALVQESRRLSSAAGLLPRLDLLDLGPLTPFTTQALAHVLLTVGLLAVFGLFVVDQGVTPIVVIMTLLTLVLAVASLMLPLRGARNAIVAAKSAELAWIHDRIRDHTNRLRGSTESAAGDGLADLVAYRKLVEDVREWPFSQSSVVRMTLYLLIPIGSWLASGLVGAIVERSVFSR